MKTHLGAPLRRAGAGLLLLAALLPLAALTAGPVGAAARSATPAKWDPRLQPIATKVEELRGLKFDHPVAAEFLSDAAFEKKVAVDKGKLSKQDKEDIARAQGQLRALGLIGPDVNIVDAMSSLQTSGVLAYYDPKTQKVTVKGTDTRDVATRVTLAHELTHALQDQHFGLQNLEKAAAKAHASDPLRALVEGDAVRVQEAYADALPQSDRDTYRAEQAATTAAAQNELSGEGVPDALSALFEAPYDFGPSMLEVAWAAAPGGINGLFRSPPTTDAAYLTPSTLAEQVQFPKVARPGVTGSERIVGKPDTFGSFALYLVLASRLGPADALHAADAWGGDAMITFTKDKHTCLRTRMVGHGTAGTAAIGDALTRWSSAMPPGTTQVVVKPAAVLLTACDTGATGAPVPHTASEALTFAASRDELFASLLKQKLTTPLAVCASDALVRDPSFAPLLAHPNVAPDATATAALQQRAAAIGQSCRAGAGGATGTK
jgi:hypothetical protein